MAETPTILDPSEMKPYERWVTEITYAEKEREAQKFLERGRRVTRRYVDERDAVDAAQNWFNLFFANTNILRSALYANMPKPEVKRKYTDYNDDVARVAATILQRAITPDQDDPRDTFDAAMRHAVTDRLVPGLGTVWLRVETETTEEELSLEPVPDHPGEGLGEGNYALPAQGFPNVEASQPYTRITDQRIAVDYVYWEDFLWSPCRVWEERRWVARVAYMDREQLTERFGEELAKMIPMNTANINRQSLNDMSPRNLAIQRARIYEIWDRTKRKIIWISREYPEILDEQEDFLALVGFEPCPKPMLANISTANSTPRPDYYMVQDQYEELDNVNNRISNLVKACKVVGVYDRASEGVQRMLLEGADNILIPVDNWAAFSEKGGVKGQVDWLPLEQVTNTLQRLYEAREGIKQQIYELTGIADIVRGQTKASETLGAQEIKAKFASVRIKSLQDEVARFVTDTLRIKAELMIKHFAPDILIRKSNIQHTDDAPLAEQAVQLLQTEEGFEWRIAVTSDQLSQADYAMEKADRIELLKTVSGYLGESMPMVQQMPQVAPLLLGMLKWAVSGFRGAREIETMLDQSMDAAIKQSQQPPPPPPPDPEVIKAQTAQQMGQMELEFKGQENQMELQKKEMDMALNARKAQQDMAVSNMKFNQQIEQMATKLLMPQPQGKPQ